MSEITEAQTGRATNFIRNIIEEDLAAGVNQPRLWCGTERLSAYWARQEHLPELRSGA